MARPDYAKTDNSALTRTDLRFLIEHFPSPGRSYAEIAAVIDQLPTTLESMLESDYVAERILDRRGLLLDVSPFLLFNVLFRRSLPGKRNALERKVINYIANMLSLFVRVDRLYRVRPTDPVTSQHIVDMIQRIPQAATSERFAIYAHIGNFALFLTGMFPDWIEHRFRFKRRLVNRTYYEDQGCAYYHQAGLHPLADQFELHDVFLHLALGFSHYSQALNQMRRNFFEPG
jgi:hypothetical protein